MAKWKVGYKVLSRRNKTLESYVIEIPDGGIRYYINKVNKPQKDCGPLFVFDNLSSAQRIAFHNRDVIYKCLYVKSKRKYVYNKIYVKLDINGFDSGTVFADKIRLIERIK